MSQASINKQKPFHKTRKSYDRNGESLKVLCEVSEESPEMKF